MLHFIQKLFYSIKYRRVLKTLDDPKRSLSSDQSEQANESNTAGQGFVVHVVMAGFLLVPFLIGCGFGLVHYRISNRLAQQRAVDQHGVKIIAVIQSLEIETIHHDRTGVDQHDSESKYCLIGIQYSPPGSKRLFSRTFRLEDDTVCQRHNVGDKVSAKMLVDQPDVVVLDEGRLSESWYWVSLMLCVFFSGLPILAGLRMIQVASRRTR